MMKKAVKRSSAAFLSAIFIILMIPVNVYAGSFSVSATSLTLTVGGSGGVTLTADDAVGVYSISTDGGVTASTSASSSWIEDESVYITITGNTVGTGHVYITITDGTDNDGNDLTGKSFTVTVTVKSASGGTVTEETTVAAEEVVTTTTAAETTTEETTEETTTEDPEIALLTTTVDDTEMLVLKDISDITLPEGFSIEETEYNTVAVQTMVCDDIRLYILKNTSDGTTDYYTLDETGGEFKKLSYTEISGVGMCIFLEIPDELEIPDGYSLVEAEICGCSVEALVVDGSEEETETETETETVTVITTSYSAVTDLTASSDGHYFVYCLLAGEKVLCDYDSEQDILQRCVSLPSAAADDEPETETEEPETETEEEMSTSERGLTVILLIAAAVIIIFAVLNIIRLVRRRG